MKKNVFYLGALLSIIIASTSCESSTYDEISVLAEHPTYEANVKPIMTANCISCHSVDGGQLPYLQTYDQVKDAVVNGILLQRIEEPTGQGMPADQKMPQANINTINNWVNQGFVNQ